MSDYKKIVIREQIVGGEKGNDGPPGPPGAGVSLPLPASDVSVINAGYATAQEVFDALLYVIPEIDFFVTLTTLFENRDAADPSADFTIDFDWLNNKTITSQTLVGPAEMTPVVLTPGQVNVTVTLTNYNTNGSFTLEITDEVAATDSKTIDLVFTNKVYFGDAAIPGVLNDTFIKSLSSNLQVDNTMVTTSDTGTGVYFWFASPVAYGAPTITVGGFTMDVQTPILHSFTNNLGYTENYNVYRATNDNLGFINVNTN